MPIWVLTFGGIVGEATVRLPQRGQRWIAVYTGDEPGVQMARSTGLTNRGADLELARKWEAEARQRRRTAFHEIVAPGTKIKPGGLTQDEVARILKLQPRTVRTIERRAIHKLSRNRELMDLWSDFLGRRFSRFSGRGSSR